MKKNITRRAAAVAAIAGAAVMGLSSIGAGGAAAGPLPGGKAVKTLVDGTPVTITLFDESASVQRPVSNVPTSREAWVSGKVKVTVGGKAEGGSIKVGYDLGCQVNFSSNGISVPGVGGSIPFDGSTPTGGITDPEVGAGLSLGPGQAGTVWLINTTSGDSTAYKDYNVNDYSFKGNTGGVAYSQEQFKLEGCAGYAAARARIQVSVSTDSVKGVVTLTGKQFSLG